MEIVLVNDAKEIDVSDTDCVGFDIETHPRRQFLKKGVKDLPVDPRYQRTVLAQICVGETVYVLRKNFASLRKLLANKHIVKVIHNAEFELKFMQHEFGLKVHNIFDTMIAEAIIESGRRPHLGLDPVCEKYLQIKLNKEVRELFIEGARITRKMIEYAAIDAWVMPQLYRILKRTLYPAGRRVLALEHRLVPVVVNMELAGITLDRKAWTHQADTVQSLLESVKTELLSAEGLPVPVRRRTVMGGIRADVNLNSREQLLPLFEAAGLDMPDLKKATVEKVLAETQHPLLAMYARYTKLSKAANTYGYRFLRHISPITKRVHQQIKQIETRTGRLAGTEPNLMNIPKRGGTIYRECFIAGIDHLFAIADYSQQELRILAEFSRDPELIRAFEQGIDVHAHAARLLFRDPDIPDKGDKRDAAKTLNFGLVYGMGFHKLALALKCSLNEARELMDLHAETFPQSFEFLNDMVGFAREHGYVETLLGRRRNLDTTVDDFERQAKNTPIQASAADMTKLACVLVDAKGEQLVNVVHDELVVETPKRNAHDSLEVLQFSMMVAARSMVKNVPFAVEGYLSERWSKPKKEEVHV